MSMQPTARPRGRPPKSAADQDAMKAKIVAATIEAFAEYGTRNMNVEHVLSRAGVSRPTFYKYFRQLDEPLALAAQQMHHGLVKGVAQALTRPGDMLGNAIAAFDAYVDWGRSLGTVIRPLFAEMYETSSPLAQYRLQTIGRVQQLITEVVKASGRSAPSPTALELFITGVEFLAFRYLLRSDDCPEAYGETRQVMMRLLVATLGDQGDLQSFVPLWPARPEVGEGWSG